HSLGNTINHAAHVQQKAGEIEVLYHSARRILYSIAAQVEHEPEKKDLLANEVNIAKHVVCNHAIEIVSKAMKIVGGRSLSKDNKLERLFRDVQCGAFNPPLDDVVITQLSKAAVFDLKHEVFQL